MFKTFYPLYIDPGTGSALFSIVIGAVAVAYFFSRAFLIKIKSFFSGQKGAKVLSSKYRYVIYAEDKRYWVLFKPVLDEFESRKLELLYLTSSEDDPVFTGGYCYIRHEFIGKGNKAYARLNMLSASLVLATTPGLGVYQWKRSKNVGHYSHVLHSVVDATLYRMFGLDYFDSILMTGDYQADDIRKIEKLHRLPEKQLVTVGCSYLDEYEKAIRQIPREEPHEFTVLVSPSWGPSSLLIRYGEKLLDALADTGWRILIRPHPQSKISEGKNLAALTERYRQNKNLVWDYERDNIHALSKADVMISDFSGIIFDYVFLCGKPVIYINYEYDLRPYDAHFLPDVELWQVKTLRKIGVELREADFGNIKDIITKAGGSAVLNKALQEAKEAAWQCRGMAGKLTADFMVAAAGRFQNQAEFIKKSPEGVKPK